MNKPHLKYINQTPKERTWTIHILAIIKLVKGVLLLIVGIKLLTLINKDAAEVFEAFITRHGIDSGNRIAQTIAEKLEGVGKTQMILFSLGSFCYSGLQLTEGIGLWMQKRWAELLTVIATSLLIPVEIYEIYEKFTWVRLLVFAVNIFIVWYLAMRLKDEKKVEKLEGEV
jgi:uncharacterized membrane protein (DUF2068 family)